MRCALPTRHDPVRDRCAFTFGDPIRIDLNAFANASSVGFGSRQLRGLFLCICFPEPSGRLFASGVVLWPADLQFPGQNRRYNQLDCHRRPPSCEMPYLLLPHKPLRFFASLACFGPTRKRFVERLRLRHTDCVSPLGSGVTAQPGPIS